MSEKDEHDKVLLREHMSVLTYMRYRQTTPYPPSVCRRKNAKDSVKYRQNGNDLYKLKNHDEKMHENIWRKYTQSIALAPNNSEELALGYGNRSALLFHLEKFKECIKDCDRALGITRSNCLKIKLLTRKAECLFLLHKPTAEDVSKEAMQILENTKLDDKVAKSYLDKLNDISCACDVVKSKEKSRRKKDKKKYFNELSDFPRSEEVPCASKSVAIRYSRKWGRHVVATEDMRPGEIFAIEKNYYTYINGDGLYLYCSYCTKYTWSSIPCEHCIYGVYCSESCRTKAWEKYHQWECRVYPSIWDIDEDINAMPFSMRMVLIALHEVGGIDNMKKLLYELDRCKDPRTKGFSEGIFKSDSAKSIYSLSKHCISNDPFTDFSLTEQSCITIELLARKSTFFGHKMDGLVPEIFENKDVVFVAALMLHTQYLTRYNAEHHSSAKSEKSESVRYSTTVRAFLSLINHSCDPNVQLLVGKNNMTIAYTLKPIKKGTQLVYSYIDNDFLDNPKEERQAYLQSVYNIECQCLPCIENWSHICLPTAETICEITPELQEIHCKIHRKMKQIRKLKGAKHLVYCPKLMRDFVFYIESMAEKITIYCEDCVDHMRLFENLYHDVFGGFHFTIPDKCYSS